jgi:hypothetical protein
MNRRDKRLAGRAVIAAGFAAFVGLAAPTARAQNVDCTTLPNPIHGDGGSAAQNYIGKLAAILAAQNPPVTVIYKGSGACNGPVGLNDQTVKLSGNSFYWTAAGVQQTCTYPTVGGPSVEWGNMVNSHKLCAGIPDPLPATIKDVEGPVTAINFITSAQSTETVISSEAAYLAYGFAAGAGQAAPWTTEANVFRRNAASAAGLYVGLAIGVHPNQQKGTLFSNQTQGIASVAGVTPPSSGLSYVSSDAADAARATVKTLAYQHKNQLCGYLPDSTGTSFDKKNVRDGHYWLWGAQHFYGLVNGQGAWVNPNVGKLIDLVSGVQAPPAGVNVAKAAIDTGNVPRCAMNVWRDGDLGEFYSYAPVEPCACYFEKNVPGGSTGCTVCTGTGHAPCAAAGANAQCRNGFCEAY